MLTPPTAEGGALRSQDLRTPATRPALDGSIIRVDPATGAGLPTNPLAGSCRPERAADRRLRPAQSVPLHVPARDAASSGSATSAGTTGRRSTDPRSRPTRPSRTSAGPATRAPGGSAGYDAPNLHICENLYGSPSARHEAVLHVPPRATRWSPARRCPTGGSSISGLSFEFAPPASTLPGRVSGRALLRRLLARLHLGDARRTAIRSRRPGASTRSSPARRTPSISSSGRTASSTTSTSTAARSVSIVLLVERAAAHVHVRVSSEFSTSRT